VKTGQTQSLAGVIRERLDAIEARLAVGVRQEAILAELAADGYETTLKNLRNELCRARKWKSAVQPAAPVGGKVQPREAPSKAANQGVGASKPAGKGQATPGARKTPVDPLTKPVGFNYGGTKDLSEDDLI